ncbi:MAG: hypothetical protein CML56_05310 [Rhodobacteraceae bacterium]|nr:hypothetical protein [Paracoccaceae bacterium]
MTRPCESDSELQCWLYRPAKPIALNPIFEWPPKPLAIWHWYSAYWLAAATTTLAVVLAVVAYFIILPPLSTMQSVELKWVIQV